MERNLTESERSAIATAYQSGVGPVAIARSYGVNRSTVYDVLQRMGIQTNHRHSLSGEQRVSLSLDYQGGATLAELSKKYGVHTITVRAALRAAGMIPPASIKRGGPILLSERLLCASLYRDGLSIRQVAERTGMPPTRVRNALKAHGITRRPVRRYLSLTDEQQYELCCRYEAGENYQQLGDDFGIAPTTVGEYLELHGVKPRVGWTSYRVTEWQDRRGRKFCLKSRWEVAYAEYLDQQGLNWDYEAARFPLKVRRWYTPDFWIMDGDEVVELVEVKGWLDSDTVNRILEFASVYPSEAKKLRIIGPAEMACLGLAGDWHKGSNAAKKVESLRKMMK